MTKSESIKELATALSKFQGELKAAKKEASNPFFKSKYADLATILETIRVPLASNGLSITQHPGADGLLETLLLHNSGEWILSTFVMKPAEKVIKTKVGAEEISKVVPPTPQDAGSALSYARRYVLSAILGVGAEDDDGAQASGTVEKKKLGALPAYPVNTDEMPF